uniref:Uncharacterized protein n=1 Tax=Spongospora subterranea TaxID=70186 RepID=A0A0H5R5G3_9EUKA|eukprot:CRZ09022.1 hypothetical protein [Spongospora subterranea]
MMETPTLCRSPSPSRQESPPVSSVIAGRFIVSDSIVEENSTPSNCPSPSSATCKRRIAGRFVVIDKETSDHVQPCSRLCNSSRFEILDLPPVGEGHEPINDSITLSLRNLVERVQAVELENVRLKRENESLLLELSRYRPTNI